MDFVFLGFFEVLDFGIVAELWRRQQTSTSTPTSTSRPTKTLTMAFNPEVCFYENTHKKKRARRGKNWRFFFFLRGKRNEKGIKKGKRDKEKKKKKKERREGEGRERNSKKFLF